MDQAVQRDLRLVRGASGECELDGSLTLGSSTRWLHLRVGNGSEAAYLSRSHKPGERPEGSPVSYFTRSLSKAKPLMACPGLSHTSYLRTESSVRPECPSASVQASKNGLNGNEKMGELSCFVVDQRVITWLMPAGWRTTFAQKSSH